MPVTFPTSLDTTTFPVGGTLTAETLAVEPHSRLHAELGQAVLRLETKVGIDASTDVTSIDYKLAHLPTVPVGVIWPYGGLTPPTSFLMCDGSSLATTGLYAALFAVFQYSFGGSGANFNLPDLRGRVIVGLDAMGGTAANRVPGATIGVFGGEATHPLTVPEMAVHGHVMNHSHPDSTADGVGDHTHTQYGGFVASGPGAYGSNAGSPLNQTGGAGAHSHTTHTPAFNGSSSNAGSGTAHNNLQPYLPLNCIVKYQ